MNNAQLNELKQRYVANGAASPATQLPIVPRMP